MLACLLPVPAWGSSPRQRLSAAWRGYHGAGTGAIAVDLTTARPCSRTNAGASLLPAIQRELALTYAALVVLGPTFRMRTELLGEGHLRDGRRLGGRTWSCVVTATDARPQRPARARRALRESGIRRVTGGLIADESYFDTHRSGPGGRATSSPGSRAHSRPSRSAAPIALATAKAMREALRAAGVRVQGTTRRARGRRLAARGAVLAAAPGVSAPDGHRERQPHRGARAETARLGRGSGRHDGGRGGDRPARRSRACRSLGGVRIADGRGSRHSTA